MATVKLKRGQESKVASLPKEDGSLIFGYNTTSVPATMQLDQNISGTIQRLNLSVANSSTSDYSKNSAALGSSSLSQILNYVNSKDIKVTQLTNQDLNDIKTPGFYYAAGSNSCTNRPSGIDAFGLEVIRTAGGYFTQRLTTANTNSNTIYTRYYNSSVWSTWTNTFKIKASTASTADVSKNSNALEGSSLQQILDEIDSTSGSGNAFTAVDTASNSTIKLTRANGGTVQKVINNVAHATSADNSDKLDGYNENVFLRYRSSTKTNFDNSFWDQIGIKEYDDAYPDGLTDGKYDYGEVISLPSANVRFDLWVNHHSSDTQNNGIQYRSGWGSDKKDWRMILDDTNYTSYAADRNAFTGIDTTTNNTIKLTRANGGTVQKVIDNVSHASTSSYSSNSGQLQGHTITAISSGSSATFANKIVYANSNGVTELSRYIDFHGDATSRDYSLRFDTGVASNLTIIGPSASTVTASYFNGIAKNSNALGGSSLSQVLASAGSGKYLPLTGGTLSNSLTVATTHIPQLTLNNQNGGDVILNLNRGSNADWRFYGQSGNLKVQCDYTSSKGSFYDVLTLNYSSGNANFKGTATATSFNGMLARGGKSVSWRTGNYGDGVLINQFSYTGWNPILRAKSSNGVWTFGPYSENILYLNYTSDTTIATTTNTCDKQIKIYPNGDLSGLHTVTASTFTGYLNGNAKNSNALGGSSLQQILESFNTGDVSADSATRIVSSSKSIANNFTIRTGTPTSSGWTQYPIYPISTTTDPDLTAYKGKSLSILHMDGGAQRHDIVALNGANDGLIYATATSAGTTSSRIERILDGGNYGSLITNLNKQVTFSNGLKAQSNVQMDGGNFSTGSTVTTGNGETSFSDIKIYVNGNTLVISTK